MHVRELETPSLLLDRVRMERNIDRMRKRMQRLGVGFRPHLKTSKCVEVSRRMMTSPAGPATVSTLKEAEYFFSHGVVDLLYAVGIAEGKLPHVLDLRARGADLKIVLDSVEMAQAVAAFSRERRHPLPVLIEIDCDGHRSGVLAESAELTEIGRVLHGTGALLSGVMTHAGSSYDCRSIDAIRAVAERERALTVRAAERVRAAGLPCPAVSVGSTPTATYAEHLTGVSEVRAGVFAFFDLVMAGIGVCAVDDIALSVLTTVIGHQRDKGWLITDAGWMAVSRDRGTAHQSVDQGYGAICDEAGTPIEGLIMSGANQEHGIVSHRSADRRATPLLPLGTRLRVLPNHACATGAQHDRYHVVAGTAPEISAVWPRINAW
jgi:D-serine deaminase-like pyridoxal phosphate-dependent protein